MRALVASIALLPVLFLISFTTDASETPNTRQLFDKAHAALKKKDLKEATLWVDRALKVEQTEKTVDEAERILRAVNDPRADELAMKLREIQVFQDFFVVPDDTRFEIEGKVRFSSASDWIGVNEKSCALVKPEVSISIGKAEFSSDSAEPAEASTIKFTSAGTRFALKKSLGVAASIKCAKLSASTAKLNGKSYRIGLPGNYIGDEDTDCKRKGPLPVTVSVDSKTESTWLRDFCSIPRHGLASGEASAIWAGDLDGDEKLDLILRLPDHPMAASYLLLLSKEKEKNILFSFSRPGNPGC